MRATELWLPLRRSSTFLPGRCHDSVCGQRGGSAGSMAVIPRKSCPTTILVYTWYVGPNTLLGCAASLGAVHSQSRRGCGGFVGPPADVVCDTRLRRRARHDEVGE